MSSLPIEQDFDQLALSELDCAYRVARSFTRNATEAEDLVQEMYAKALRAKGSFRATSAMRPWLLKILRNTWLNQLSSRRRDPELCTDEFLGQLPAGLADPVETDWTRSDSRLVAAISELPESLRTAMLLWAIAELTYKEIAEVTEVPIGTVMSRLHRARGILAVRLASLASERRIR